MKMKKSLLKGGIACLFLLLAGALIYKVVKESASQSSFAEIFPTSLSFINPDYYPVETDSIIASYLITVFYSSDCLFCQHEAKELSRNSANFKRAKILFITPQHPDSASLHRIRFRLDTIPNYLSLIDTSGKAIPRFGIRSIPTTLLYNKNRELIKSFEGEINAKSLIKTITDYEKKQQ